MLTMLEDHSIQHVGELWDIQPTEQNWAMRQEESNSEQKQRDFYTIPTI